ncbi:YiiX/YebB-like N1pC/P60 family cysteine hydrolase [Kushneria aurantia]|uniref:YiiX/YebB-like N1pC/P60 family cysteine hydrolase n=1 Tax=Kushneria aurantia TaxID=504092 RepID=A0ABV6G5I2_9GAMM|nr:YiiX/YebB-like N1pC/P60 family cysteine hydrolase [Kushneria aurantia]
MLCCWLWLLCCATTTTAAEGISPRSGDLIFREGTAFVSEAVRRLDRGAFSHVGLLAEQNGRWWVVHATPDAGEERGSGVVTDTLASFTAPERSRRYAIYHVDADNRQRRRAVQWAMAQLGTPFAILGSEGIYCTTLVWQAWQQAGVDLEVHFSRLNIPLASGDFLMPSDLLASPRLTRVSSSAPATPQPAAGSPNLSDAVPPAP